MDKTRVQEILDQQPDELDLDEFLERLYLLRKIESAEAELSRGEGIPHEQVRQRLAPWLSDFGKTQFDPEGITAISPGFGRSPHPG